MMKGQDSARIKNVIEDQAGNMVIAITKYRWTESLLHSGYGIVVVLGIVATVVLAVMGLWIWSALLVLASVFFWVKA